MRRISTVKLLVVCITITICVGIITLNGCEEKEQKNYNPSKTANNVNPKFSNKNVIQRYGMWRALRFDKVSNVKSFIRLNNTQEDDGMGEHTLAIIVPFRDRFEELMEFAPWMNEFLNNQNVRHKIIVVNQVDTHRYKSFCCVLQKYYPNSIILYLQY